MKFLPHFPPLMIILFKVYQLWRIYAVIWMPMIPANMFGQKHNIVNSYCFFIFRNASVVSIHTLEIVWNAQLDSACTCEYDLYRVRMDFDTLLVWLLFSDEQKCVN